jgi:hypothetical protein
MPLTIIVPTHDEAANIASFLDSTLLFADAEVEFSPEHFAAFASCLGSDEARR